MKSPPLRRILSLLAATAIAPAAWAATPDCCTAPTTDYPKVGGNYANQSYSSLGQITKANVTTLGGAWHVRLEGGDDSAFQQGNVVVAGGVLFAETTQGSVIALDGATGTIKWRYKGTAAQRRGVAMGEGRVFTIKGSGHVVALDQVTGAVVWEKDVVPAGDRSLGSFPTAITYFDGMIFFGTANSRRGAEFALDAKTGAVRWMIYGAPGAGEAGNETWAGDSWKEGGAAPWAQPAIDPALGLMYLTFGNARAGGPLDGGTREGQNLYANSIVAIDIKTGKRVWHFQSVHHDTWDMDNVMAPVLADLTVDGRKRQAVIYGSKTAMLYILDRKTGQPLRPIDEKPVAREPDQHSWPTQPFTRGDPLVPLCPTGKGAGQVPPHYRVGCLFTPHLDFPTVHFPGTGGGADTSAYSYNQKTGLLYVGVGEIGIAQQRQGVNIGFRPLGENRSGKVVAYDPTRGKVVWSRDNVWSLAHGNGILSTAGNVLFMGYPDGVFAALDPADGHELWRFQTGAGVHTNPIAYQIGGVEYVAVFAGGNGLPYNSPKGDHLWAFKLGGTVAQAPAPTPPPHRQPITTAGVEGASVNNTILLARVSDDAAAGGPGGRGSGTPGRTAPGAGPADAAPAGPPGLAPPAKPGTESDAQNAMSPQVMRVPVGTNVTFTNPVGNKKDHCATQFFEGLFDTKPLKPGESFRYTFKTAGEYFYNDCASPGTTGKVIVY